MIPCVLLLLLLIKSNEVYLLSCFTQIGRDEEMQENTLKEFYSGNKETMNTGTSGMTFNITQGRTERARTK